MAAEANPPDALRVHFVLYVSGASNAEFAEQFLNPVFHGAAFPSASAFVAARARPASAASVFCAIAGVSQP
jgi:hypothetical protein